MVLGGHYEQVEERVFVYRGERPAEGWHGHGFLDLATSGLEVPLRALVSKKHFYQLERELGPLRLQSTNQA